MMAVVGGMLLVGQAALAYDMGFGAIWFWIGFALAFICLGLAAKKIKTFADEHNFLTISDYLFTKFDYKTGTLGAKRFTSGEKEFDSLKSAQNWADSDPYISAGVYESVVVKPFKKVLP